MELVPFSVKLGWYCIFLSNISRQGSQDGLLLSDAILKVKLLRAVMQSMVRRVLHLGGRSPL